jgi:adenylate cyclase
MLNELFSAFGRLARRHGLEKIKTIADAYMVVGGLPDPRPDHARAVADMVLAMREEVARCADPSGQPLAVRIGIDTGPVEAGVIGTAQPLSQPQSAGWPQPQPPCPLVTLAAAAA